MIRQEMNKRLCSSTAVSRAEEVAQIALGEARIPAQGMQQYLKHLRARLQNLDTESAQQKARVQELELELNRRENDIADKIESLALVQGQLELFQKELKEKASANNNLDKLEAQMGEMSRVLGDRASSQDLKKLVDKFGQYEIEERQELRVDKFARDLSGNFSSQFERRGRNLQTHTESLATHTENLVTTTGQAIERRLDSMDDAAVDLSNDLRQSSEAAANRTDETVKSVHKLVRGGDETDLKSFIRSALQTSGTKLVGEFESRLKSWVSQNDDLTEQMKELSLGLQEADENKIEAENSHREEVRRLESEIQSLRTQVENLKLENEKYKRLQSRPSQSETVGGQGRKRSRESAWLEYVHDATTLLQCVDVRLDNSSVQETEKKLKLQKVMAKLIELLDKNESTAVGLANMSRFLQEAAKDKWYCLENVIVRGQWAPLELPTPGFCGRHNSCFQGCMHSGLDTGGEPVLAIRAYKSIRNANA